ncbi:MAG: nitroreductase [Ruminococcaceae bacterium]|nr:nitroreductase [Oscillospiraceae bacterium]
MELHEAIKLRHSVRQYRDVPIEDEIIKALWDEIDLINKEGNLHFQLVLNEPRAFNSKMAHYGRFEGVSNYFALVGAKSKDLFEKCGYYGERLVLKAQQLGLHTCWVALTYKKVPEAFRVEKGEAFTVVISVGHGRHRGLPRKSKNAEEVSNASENTPEWFRRGVESALLAPTAMNQQKFKFIYNPNGTVSAKAKLGFYTKMDLGIAKYHFEIGAGKDSFAWA